MKTKFEITGIKKETFWSGAECTSVELSEVDVQKQRTGYKKYKHFCSTVFNWSIGDIVSIEDFSKYTTFSRSYISTPAQSTIYNIDRSEWGTIGESGLFKGKQSKTKSCITCLKYISDQIRGNLFKTGSLEEGKGNRLRFILAKDEEKEGWVLTVTGTGVEINPKAYFVKFYREIHNLKTDSVIALLSPTTTEHIDIQMLVVSAGHLAGLKKGNSLIWEYVYYDNESGPAYTGFNFILRV